MICLVRACRGNRADYDDDWLVDSLVGQFVWLAGFFTSFACSDRLLDSRARAYVIFATFADLPFLFRLYLRRFVTIGCLVLVTLSALLGLLSRVEQKFYKGIPL